VGEGTLLVLVWGFHGVLGVWLLVLTPVAIDGLDNMVMAVFVEITWRSWYITRIMLWCRTECYSMQRGGGLFESGRVRRSFYGKSIMVSSNAWARGNTQ